MRKIDTLAEIWVRCFSNTRYANVHVWPALTFHNVHELEIISAVAVVVKVLERLLHMW